MSDDFKKILVVDDEIEICNIVESFLSREDYLIFKELDGVAGLEALKKIEPDLIVLDLKMPRLDGIEFLEYLKLNKLAYPVIVITGSENFLKEAVLELGVKIILEKPFDLNALLSAVKLELSIE